MTVVSASGTVQLALSRESFMTANDDVPFNRDFPLKPGVVDEVRPGVRRILCNNPSPFTFTGTVSYIVGKGKVAIIDPGPDNEAHAAALLDAVRGETVTHLLVTHTHPSRPPPPARPRVGSARRGHATRAKNSPRNPAPTAISSRTFKCAMARPSKVR